jgi:chaperonin GroES
MLSSNVLVRRVAEKEITDGGIYIPDTVKEQPAEGTVVSIGPDVTGSFGPGDVVVFGRYCGAEVIDGNEVLVLLKEKDILGVREKEENV